MFASVSVNFLDNSNNALCTWLCKFVSDIHQHIFIHTFAIGGAFLGTHYYDHYIAVYFCPTTCSLHTPLVCCGIIDLHKPAPCETKAQHFIHIVGRKEWELGNMPEMILGS